MPSAFDGYLPDGWEERQAALKAAREKEKAAAACGLSVQAYDDLQIWIRHGRIGTGRTYQEEVERAKRIDAERQA